MLSNRSIFKFRSPERCSKFGYLALVRIKPIYLSLIKRTYLDSKSLDILKCITKRVELNKRQLLPIAISTVWLYIIAVNKLVAPLELFIVGRTTIIEFGRGWVVRS